MKQIKYIILSLLLMLYLMQTAAIGQIFNRPTASVSAASELVAKGTVVPITWSGKNGTATLNGEAVGLSGTEEFTIEETTTFTLKVSGRRRTASDSVTVEVVTDEDNTDNPVPDPVEGFTLSAVGIGSAFGVDDKLSAASSDHELGEYLKSQNGTWTIILDEVMEKPHPKIFDKWISVLEKSGKKKPAVIWHNQGKVLAINEVAGNDKHDLLKMAQEVVPATREKVMIQGRWRYLGLMPPPKGVRWAGPSVSAILKPLSAEDCPSVDLSSQFLYHKNQAAGTCVLNTFSSLGEATLYRLYGKSNTLELSPYFLANLTDGYNGTYAVAAAEVIREYGNLPFGDMKPYDRLPAGWRIKAAKYKCLAVYGPPEHGNNPGHLRASLHRGYPCSAGISVGSGFTPDSNGYISYERGHGRWVNHEITVVGWNQEKRRFKIKNSWGKGWGLDGYAWLDEKFFEADNDLWVVVGMVANPSYEFYSPDEEEEVIELPDFQGELEKTIRRSTCPSGTCPYSVPYELPVTVREKTKVTCPDGKCYLNTKKKATVKKRTYVRRKLFYRVRR
jgi:hypothetical protein